MAVTVFSQEELYRLLDAMIQCRDLVLVDKQLESCHEFHTYGGLQPHERYFRKNLGYRDFKIHIPFVHIENERILEADIQFKRKSEFPSPFINRNRKLFKELDTLLTTFFEGQRKKPTYIDNLRCIHYGSRICTDKEDLSPTQSWECRLIDEPYSSGQTDPLDTKIRNDFVLIRYSKNSSTR